MNMETVKQYETAFEKARAKLIKLAKDFAREDYMRVAIEAKMSDTSIVAYCNGEGTNLKTTLVIIESIEKINKQ